MLEKICDWEKTKILGSGGFGEVSLWRNCKTEHQVAIKMCKPPIKGLSSDEEKKLYIRWNGEIQLMNKCSTDYIVKGYPDLTPIEFLHKLNQSCPKDLPVLAMEYCPEGDLRSQLLSIENRNGLKEVDVKNILFCLRNAVQYLHSQDITHRDIKPENIVIKNISGHKIYKLTDMGYAKNIDANTIAASLVGTRDYFAPEIITELGYKNTVDYWSVGVIAFEIICGIRPFIPHQQLHTSIIQIGRKSNKHIAITEVPEGCDYRFHEHLFKENRCSQVFQNLIESWLQLTLEGKGKMRGYIMNDPQQSLMTNSSSQTSAKTLMFYSMLDDILKKKILTIFNISSYEHISVLIDESMTMNEMFDLISKESKISDNYMCLWLPSNHKYFTKHKGYEGIKSPLDFYIENYDSTCQPMIYVMNMEPKQEFCPPQPFVDETIRHFFKKHTPQEAIKKHFLNEFVLKSLHFIRKEERQYLTLLGGLKFFAEQKASELEKYGNSVPSLKEGILKCVGMMELFSEFIKFGEVFLSSQNKGLQEGLDSYKDKTKNLQNDFNILEKQIVERLGVRLSSCNRRINQRLENKFLSVVYDNPLGLRDMENYLMNKKHTVQEVENQITKFIEQCLLKRSKLLASPELKSVQNDVIEIHRECETFKKAFPKANSGFEFLKNKLHFLTESFMKDYTLLILDTFKEREKQVDSLISPLINVSLKDEEASALINTNKTLLEEIKNTFSSDVEMKES